MAQCPQCYTGTCKRHRGQDHGRSAAQPSNAQGTLQKMYDMLVGSKLQKLQAEAAMEDGDRHAGAFRQQLDASREKSMCKQGKTRSKLADAGVSGSGLNPQALAATYGEASDSDGEGRRSRGKKAKKAKKKKKKKHASSSSSSRRDKDDKRSRRHKKRRHSSDDESDWSGSDSSDAESSDGSESCADSGDDASGKRKRSSKSHRSRRHRRHEEGTSSEEKKKKKSSRKRRRTDSD